MATGSEYRSKLHSWRGPRYELVDGETLLRRYTIRNAKPSSQIHWDDVPQWMKTVLGNSCNVAYHDTHIEHGIARYFWHLTGLDAVDCDVIVEVRVRTCIGPDGDLNYQESSRLIFNDLLVTLFDIQLDLGPSYEKLHDMWTPAPFGDFASCALQYARRIVLVSGNFLISGGPSSFALEPLVKKLLTYTTIDAATASLHIPHVSDYSFAIPETNKSPLIDEVRGLFTSFDVKCHVNSSIVAATADVKGYGIMLKKYDIKTNKVDKASVVTFTFVTKIVGVHNIDLCLQEALSMNMGIKRIQVSVVDV